MEKLREIKVRVWIKSRNKYLYILGFCYNYFDNSIIKLYWIEGNNVLSESFSIDDIILEQYTGRKDKNGVEIYEGDKLKNNTYTFIVYWDKDNSSFKMKNQEPGWVYDITTFIDTLIVTGNIHKAIQ